MVVEKASRYCQHLEGTADVAAVVCTEVEAAVPVAAALAAAALAAVVTVAVA